MELKTPANTTRLPNVLEALILDLIKNNHLMLSEYIESVTITKLAEPIRLVSLDDIKYYRIEIQYSNQDQRDIII